MSIALIFPGQGSQYVGMGRDLFDRDAGARTWLACAEELSGEPLSRIVRMGPREELRRPEVVELLLTVVAGAYVDRLLRAGLQPSAVAGYSAGEVAALYAAGVLNREDALQAAILRGKVLARSGTECPGGLLAVHGLSADRIEAVISRSSVHIAGRNGARHLTLGGSLAALASIESALWSQGAHCAQIDVAGPWHTPALDDAAQMLEELLKEVLFNRPQMAIFTAACGHVENRPEALRRLLAYQLCVPVLWAQQVAGLLAHGVRTFVEVGPQRVLNALLAQLPLPHGVKCWSLERGDGRSRVFEPGFIEGIVRPAALSRSTEEITA